MRRLAGELMLCHEARLGLRVIRWPGTSAVRRWRRTGWTGRCAASLYGSCTGAVRVVLVSLYSRVPLCMALGAGVSGAKGRET